MFNKIKNLNIFKNNKMLNIEEISNISENTNEEKEKIVENLTDSLILIVSKKGRTWITLMNIKFKAAKDKKNLVRSNFKLNINGYIKELNIIKLIITSFLEPFIVKRKSDSNICIIFLN